MIWRIIIVSLLFATLFIPNNLTAQIGSSWTRAIATVGWSERSDFSSVEFDGKIWIIGGYDGEAKSDVWYSSDGRHWNLATVSAP